MCEYYYKYRSLQNLRWFIEILAKQELHASQYLELNDPMEGRFIYDPSLDKEVVKNIRSLKSKTYICSLSQNANNSLMWAMYADSHKGCCIKFKVTAKPTNWHPIVVKYTEKITDLGTDSTIDEILGVKSVYWQHEEEVRFIKTFKEKPKQSPTLKIQISEIILGDKVSRKDEAFYRKLIKAILGSDVTVRKIKLEELNTGFIDE